MTTIIDIIPNKTYYEGAWDIAILSDGKWGYIDRTMDKRQVGDTAEYLYLSGSRFKHFINRDK